MNLLLALALGVGYLYRPADWLNYPSAGFVCSISADAFSVYVFSPTGVFVVDRAGLTLVRTITTADRLPARITLGAADPETGDLWVLATDELVSFDPASNLARPYGNPLPGANSLGVGLGYLYLDDGTRQIRVNKATGAVEQHWVSTRDITWYGADRPYQPSDFLFLTPYDYIDESFQHHGITTLFLDQGTLWVGTDGYGVLAYAPETHIARRVILGPGPQTATQLFADEKGLWLRAADEYYFYEFATGTWRYYSLADPVFVYGKAVYFEIGLVNLARTEPVMTVVPDRAGFWVGSTRGLYWLDAGHHLTAWHDFGVPVYKVLVAGDTVLAASAHGLFRFSRADTVATRVNDPAGHLGFGVYDIAVTTGARYFAVTGGVVVEDSAGGLAYRTWPGESQARPPRCLAARGEYLFVGLDDGLLIAETTTGRYERLTPADGLLPPPVFGLYADDRYVWVLTAGGLSRFSYSRLFPPSPR